MAENVPTIKTIARWVDSLKTRLGRLEKDVRAIKDILNTHDNWISFSRKLVGSSVVVRCRCGDDTTGILKWTDRYNVCIVRDDGKERVFTKGGIDWIDPA
jgi:hypothetical protein